MNRRDAITAVRSLLPDAYRRLAAITGDQSTTIALLRGLMRRAARQAPLWRDEDAAARWFLHHSLISSRQASTRARTEPLISSPAASPQYAAFLRALRDLPRQQVEAIILHHGANLNPRFLAIAMDCSVQAAQMHLDAGVAHLRVLAGPGVESLFKELGSNYSRLAAPPHELERLEDILGLALLRRRAARWARLGLIWGLVMVLIWIAVRLAQQFGLL